MAKKDKVPKSLTKAATKNMKIIKHHELSKKERIDKLIESRKTKVESPKTVKEKKERFIANEAVRRSENYCSVESFERSVYSIEGIKVILRAPTHATVGRYTYRSRCSKNTTIRDFIRRRINPCINSTYEVYIASDKKFSMDDPISAVTNYDHSNSLVD